MIVDSTTVGSGDELTSILERRKKLSESAEVNQEKPQPEEPKDVTKHGSRATAKLPNAKGLIGED